MYNVTNHMAVPREFDRGWQGRMERVAAVAGEEGEAVWLGEEDEDEDG